MRNEDYLYKILPPANAHQFPKMHRQLRRLGVSAEYCEGRGGTRIYRVARAECDVLPNRNGPILPVSAAKDKTPGFELGKLRDVDQLRASWGCCAWREID